MPDSNVGASENERALVPRSIQGVVWTTWSIQGVVWTVVDGGGEEGGC